MMSSKFVFLLECEIFNKKIVQINVLFLSYIRGFLFLEIKLDTVPSLANLPDLGKQYYLSYHYRF